MNTIKVTQLQKTVLEALALEMYGDRGYSDVGLPEVMKRTGLSPNVISGVAGSLVKKGLIEIDWERIGKPSNVKFYSNRVWYLLPPVEGLVPHWIEEGAESVQLITE